MQLYSPLKFFDGCPVNSDYVADTENLGTIYNSLCVENAVNVFIIFLDFFAFGWIGLVNNLEGLNETIGILD